MTKYTTITVRKNVLESLNRIKDEIGAKSLGEAIEELIRIYKKVKAKEFVKDVERVRSLGLKDVKDAIEKLRAMKWARL
ncbi:MAG: hypothetical protein ACTSVA_09645 [Candidatus Njordarchaeales archaeon]